MKRFLELNRLYFRYKKVIQNFFWRFLQIAGRQGIIFLIFILSAKFLEPEEFGKLNYVLAIIFFFPLIFLVPAISLLDGIYRGLKKFKFLSSISLTIGVVSIGFVYFLVRNYRLIGAIISQNLFYFVLFIALFIFYKEKHFRI